MASDQTLRAIITVVDQTSAPLQQISARFTAMSSPIRNISSRIGELAEQTGIKDIGEHAGAALEKVRGLGQGLLDLSGPLATLGAAGSLAGLVEIAKSTAEFAEKLDIGAAKTGIATEALAGWHYAAGLVNVDADQLDKAFGYLNRNIAEAAGGKAKDLQEILTGLGLQNTTGHLVGTADALKAVAADVQHLVGSGQLQLATEHLSKLFGARRGAELLPLFEQGPEAITKALGEAQKAGISLTAAQAASGRDFMEKFKGMQASVEGLKVAIGDELFPVLTPVIEGTRQWLNANREWIATKIGEAVKYLSDAVKSVNWTKVGEGLKAIAKDAKWVFDEIGGVKGVLIAIGVIEFGSTITEFGKLGAAAFACATKVIGIPIADLVSDFAKLNPALTSAKELMIAFDAAADANPLGVLAAAAVALAAALYEIYKHWPQISHGFEAASSDMAPPGQTGYFDPNLGAFVQTGTKPLLDGGKSSLSRLNGEPPLSTLPGAQAAAGAVAPREAGGGITKIIVDIRNLLPGSKVSTESSGNAPAPDVNVGMAMPGY